MATPLSRFSNARIRFEQPGGRGGPETGFQLLPGKTILVIAFLKQATPGKRNNYISKTDLKISEDVFEGYVTGWVELPEGADWQSYAYANDSNLNSSGTRPEGFLPPAPVELNVGGISSPAAQLLDSAGTFGDTGIGATIRGVIGDRLVIKAERF